MNRLTSAYEYAETWGRGEKYQTIHVIILVTKIIFTDLILCQYHAHIF